MNKDILCPNGSKTVTVVVADPLGKTSDIGRKLEVRPLDITNLARISEAEEPLNLKHVCVLDAHLLTDLALKGTWHGTFDFEADHLPPTTLAQRRLELHHQVGRFVVDFDFAVANDAERTRTDDLVAREHLVEEELDQSVDGHDFGAALRHQLGR